MLNEDAEHELDHLAVKGRVHKGEADIQINQAIRTQIILKDFVFDIEVIDVLGHPITFISGNAGHDLDTDQGKDAGVDKNSHG